MIETCEKKWIELPGLMVWVHLGGVLSPPQADQAPLLGVQAGAGHTTRLYTKEGIFSSQ